MSPRGNADGATPEDFTTTNYYDEVGNLFGVDRPGYRFTTMYHDELNRLAIFVSPLSEVTETTYDAAGHRTSHTNPNTKTSTWTYDDAGRLETASRPGETRPPSATTRTATGSARPHPPVTASPPGPMTTPTAWRPRSTPRATSWAVPQPTTPPPSPTTRTATSSPAPTSSGTSSSWTYDALNNQTSETTPRGNTTGWTYNARGQITSVNPPGSGSDSTIYDYDDHGDLVSVVNGRGKEITYAYTDRHEKASATDPLDRTKTYEYDEDGNLISWVTARGNALGADPEEFTVTQTWDNAGDMVARTTPDADSTATFTYDPNDRVATMDDVTGTTEYTYDPAGQLTDVTHPQGDYEYTYTDAGDIETRTYPEDGTIEFTYNTDGLPDSLEANSLTTTFDYTANRQLADITYPSAVDLVEHREYRRDGTTDSIQTKDPGAGTPLSRFDYTYNDDGAPTAITTTRDTTVTDRAYTYDNRGQLTKECYDTSCVSPTSYIAYDYDNNGNRLEQDRVSVPNPGTTTYTYDDADQLTSSDDGSVTNYTYDADGNLASDGREWNTLNQLVASNVTGNATYAYDGTGLRRSITVGTDVRELSWDINNPIALLAVERDPSDNPTTYRYTPEGSALSAEHGSESYTRSFYARDAMGSITDAVKGDGTPTWALDYDAFGSQDAQSLMTGAVSTPMSFTSAYAEQALDGELYLRARDYDPASGRFHATDPWSPPATRPALSPYSYVNNQPTVYSDPLGLCFGPDWACDVAKSVGNGVKNFTVGMGGGFLGFTDLLGGTLENITGIGYEGWTDDYYAYYEDLWGVDRDAWTTWTGEWFTPLETAGIIAKLCKLAKGARAEKALAPGLVKLDRSIVSTSISRQRQNRHVLGAREYNGGSYFNSVDDAQRVLDDFHSGAAEILGFKGKDILVRTRNVTGTNVNPGAGFPQQATNVFFIKGTKSPSVVPYNPMWKP